MPGLFIDVKVDASIASDAAVARKLADACPVDIFEASDAGITICEANLDDNVKDPELREKLRPDYRAGCKRLVISADFYDAVQKPHVKVVTEGIERIEAAGVRTVDGQLRLYSSKDFPPRTS